jgi:hypothetical protein
MRDRGIGANFRSYGPAPLSPSCDTTIWTNVSFDIADLSLELNWANGTGLGEEEPWIQSTFSRQLE